MKIKLTYKQRILEILAENPDGMSCQKICEKLIVEYDLKDNKARYISGSVSSKLRKLVNDKILKYKEEVSGPRGGHIYQLNIKK